jgi:hypothetical protein
MLTLTRDTLSAAAVMAALFAPSAAHASSEVSPSPRGVAIGQTHSQNASGAARPNSDQQTPRTNHIGDARHVRAAEVLRCPAGAACISLDSTLTQGIADPQKEAAVLDFNRASVTQTTDSSSHGSGTSGDSRRPTATSSGGAFGWGDAGIGAGGMLLLVSAAGAVAVTTRRRRHRVTAS